METCFTLWICTCSKTVFCQHSQLKLFSVRALSYTSVYCSRFKIWNGQMYGDLKPTAPPPPPSLLRNENSWIIIFVSPKCKNEASVCIFPIIFCIGGTQPTQCMVKEALLWMQLLKPSLMLLVKTDSLATLSITYIFLQYTGTAGAGDMFSVN